MAKVRFQYADVDPVRTSNKRIIQQWAASIFEQEGRRLQTLNYIFCSDEYLLSINRQYLQHDYYTDIITFDLTESGTAGIIGEIYISVDRVRENANEHSVPFKQELLRVIAHGALHLCGYGDKTKREITIMRNKEEDYLRKFEE